MKTFIEHCTAFQGEEHTAVTGVAGKQEVVGTQEELADKQAHHSRAAARFADSHHTRYPADHTQQAVLAALTDRQRQHPSRTLPRSGGARNDGACARAECR